MTNNLTDEQRAIISFAAECDDSFIIDAKAGSGKTSTLLEMLSVLRGNSVMMAFNKSIADDIRNKVSRKGFEIASRVDVRTVHSLGLKAFSQSGIRAKTLDGKVGFMLKDHLNYAVAKDDDIWRNMGKVLKLVGSAKAAGFGITNSPEEFPRIDNPGDWEALAEHYNIEEDLVGDTTLEEVCELSMSMLKMSNARTNSIDFDDMVYLPLLMGMKLPLFQNVMIDEAQDINGTRRELAFRCVDPYGGRLIAVGDPHQAIYGFTGADTKSLQSIQQRARATTFPLTICWRCDEDIIRSAQEQVPDIRARPDAPSGQVLTIDFEKDNFLDMPQAGDAILCRTNKPNVAVCLGLMRRGVRAKIEGRDLGKRLEYHVQKATQLYNHQPLDDTLLDMETYKDAEIGKLVAKNKSESAIALLEDEVEAAMLIIEKAIEVAMAENRPPIYQHFASLITSLFGDDVKGCVVLSSVHKAKGREWKRVFILGYADWMPHRMAKMPWEIVQEHNLIYVAKTRAERTLVFVNGAQSAIDRGLHREVKKAQPAEAQVMPATAPVDADPEPNYGAENPPAPTPDGERIRAILPPGLDLSQYRKER